MGESRPRLPLNMGGWNADHSWRNHQVMTKCIRPNIPKMSVAMDKYDEYHQKVAESVCEDMNKAIAKGCLRTAKTEVRERWFRNYVKGDGKITRPSQYVDKNEAKYVENMNKAYYAHLAQTTTVLENPDAANIKALLSMKAKKDYLDEWFLRYIKCNDVTKPIKFLEWLYTPLNKRPYREHPAEKNGIHTGTGTGTGTRTRNGGKKTRHNRTKNTRKQTARSTSSNCSSIFWKSASIV